MPEYLHPGVYVAEIPAGPRPIQGVGTSTAGFVGMAERGPTQPRLVTSWSDYRDWFGDTIAPEVSFMPLSIRGFFDNGGQRTFIARVVGANAATGSLDIPTSGSNAVLRLTAIGPGAWSDRVLVRVQPATRNAAAPANWFRLTLLYYTNGIPAPFVDPLDPATRSHPSRREPDVFEDYDCLTSTPGELNFVEAVVNTASRLVSAAFQGADAGGTAGFPRPENTAAAHLAGGTDGDPIDAVRFVGNAADRPAERTGLAGLVAIYGISLISAPDEVNPAVPNGVEITNALIDQCERLRDRFTVLSIAAGRGGVQQVHRPRESSYGAVYFPWIRVRDPRTLAPVLMPPSGAVMGIYARTDTSRGVHKAPANVVVRGLIADDPGQALGPLEFQIGSDDQEVLNARGVNVIRDFRPSGRGIRVWGARTMASDPEWKYVSIRRLLIFIEESIEEGTQWAVFEPNDEPLWARLRQSISAFLTTVWRSGALQGRTVDEAFFVHCGRDTMTDDDINNGRLICELGVAPLRPAEFVIIRIQHKTRAG